MILELSRLYFFAVFFIALTNGFKGNILQNRLV